MAQRVRTDSLGNASGDGRASDGPLDDGFVQVVAAVLAGGLVDVSSGGREDPLPGPLARRRVIFLSQGVW